MFLRRAVQAALTLCLSQQEVPYTETAIEPFNLRLAYTPLAIAQPTTVQHLEKAVVCAAASDVKVNARSGGHGYISTGLGGENGHLIVDMSSFDRITVDDGGFAHVGTGARLGEVAVELNKHGRALSHGSCPGVGVGGHATHGGWGTSSHSKGFTIDWIVGATVTLANGTTVSVSESSSPDLFFAIRGAGSSFGIVSELCFNTFAAPSVVTPFTVEWDWTSDLSDTSAAEAGIKALQEWAESGEMPPEAWMNVFISQGAAVSNGLFWGTEEETAAAVQSFFNSIGGSYASTGQTDWIGQVEYFAGTSTLVGPEFDTEHDTFYATSLTTHSMNDDQVKSFVEQWFATKNPSPSTRSWWIQMDLHGGASSAIAAVPVGATAYPHRDKLLLWQFYDSVSAGTEYPADGFSLLQNLQKSITETMDDDSWGLYANYPDSQLSDTEAPRKYWGVNLPRLQSIKAAVDFKDVFHYPQGIKPQ